MVIRGFNGFVNIWDLIISSLECFLLWCYLFLVMRGLYKIDIYDMYEIDDMGYFEDGVCVL